jgi:hypothetical protein
MKNKTASAKTAMIVKGFCKFAAPVIYDDRYGDIIMKFQYRTMRVRNCARAMIKVGQRARAAIRSQTL